MNAHYPVPRFRKYALGNLAAAVGFLSVWAILLWMQSMLVSLLALSFPILVIMGFAFLWSLSGWRQVVPGVLCWALVWLVACAISAELLFRIAGPP